MDIIDGAELYGHLLCLDVEASSLHAGSYPIEIGWCGVNLVPASRLIRPLAAWGTEHWCASSKRIHGISQEHLLEFGIAPEDAARQLNIACQGKIVLSDDPTFGEFWLHRLYTDTDTEQKSELLDAVHVAGVAAGLSGLSQSDMDEFLARIHRRYPHPHRAGPDARRIAAEFPGARSAV